MFSSLFMIKAAAATIALRATRSVSVGCAPGGTCTDESLLLQTWQVHEAWQAQSWSADSFGQCLEGCDRDPFKLRSVTCVSVYDDMPSGSENCKRPTPTRTKKCSCGLEACSKLSSLNCSQIGGGEVIGSPTKSLRYDEVGCFLSDTADSEAKGIEDEVFPHRDLACLGSTGEIKCMDGLPFFRVANSEPNSCFDFCLRNGLDVFGLTSGGVCRCGATKHNHQVWHSGSPEPALVFDPRELNPGPTKGKCPLRVYRYAGHFEGKGMPPSDTDINMGDMEYMDSVSRGAKKTELEEEDSLLAEPKVLPGSNPQRRGFDERACWPSRCGAGRPWPTKSSSPPEGVDDLWQDYVNIPYKFQTGVDDTRKEAFRLATNVWQGGTCINSLRFQRLLCRRMKNLTPRSEFSALRSAGLTWDTQGPHGRTS